MASCSTCQGAGHNALKHVIQCRICGAAGSVVDVSNAEELRVARETYNCGDTEEHARVRNIWGRPYDWDTRTVR